MTTWLIIGCAIALLFAWRGWRKHQLLQKLGPAFERYNSGAYRPIRRPSEDKNFETVDRLARELQSRNGQLGIAVESGGRGAALHQINKNGTFSSRGPYFVSRQATNWHLTGRTHLVRCVRGYRGWGFESSNPNQAGGVITERGVAVLEYDTKKYSPVDIWDFAEIYERDPSTWTISKP